MSNNNNSNNNNNQRLNPSRLLQPTIAAVPRTFDAQNRPPTTGQQQQQQQRLASLLATGTGIRGGGNRRRSGGNNNLRIFADSDSNNIDDSDVSDDDDDDDGIIARSTALTSTAAAAAVAETTIAAGSIVPTTTTTAIDGVGTTFPLDIQQQMTVLENWRERERRQRTIRVFMMFLLMLLLMEEEPNSSSIRHPKNRHNHNNLRRTGGVLLMSSSSSSLYGNYNHTILTPDVYTSRIKQDEHIRTLGRTHPRYTALIEKEQQRRISSVSESVLGNDHDYNEQVVRYVLSLADIEKDEFDISNSGVSAASSSSSSRTVVDANEGTQVVSDDTTALKRNRLGASNRRARTGLIMPYITDPEDERKVYHYPWNSTGFYRGTWKRISNASHSQLYWSAHIHKQDTLDDKKVSSTVSSKMDRLEEVAIGTSTTTQSVDTMPNVPNDTMTNTLDAYSDDNNYNIHRRRRLATGDKLVSSIEIGQHMMAVLQKERKDLFGVHVLPYGYHLFTRDDNNLTTSRHEEIRYDLKGRKIVTEATAKKIDSTTSTGTSVSTPISALPSSASISTKHNNGTPPLLPVTLKLNSGRAAFQLFSRSIPAMKELSLVEGFIKLYDNPSHNGLSSKNSLLLRVRGVLIHSIGRLSLTANADASQAAFVMMGSETDVPSSLKTNPGEISEANIRKGSTDNVTNDSDDNNTFDHPESSLEVSAEETELSVTDIGDQQVLNHRQRRLKLVVDDLVQPRTNGAVSTESSIIEYIRDEAIKLFDRTSDNMEKGQKHQPTKWSLLTTGPDDVDEVPEGIVENVVDSEEIIENSLEGLLLNEHLHETKKENSKDRRLLSRSRFPQKVLALPTAKNLELNVNRTLSEKETTESPVVPKLLPPWSDFVLPFPYVKDDANETIRRARTPASSQMKETKLEANAAHCLFEINMDIEPVLWTIGSWRKLVNYHVALQKLLDPDMIDSMDDADTTSTTDEEKDSTTSDNSAKPRVAMNGGKRRMFEDTKSSYDNYVNDQALVIRMVGDITSVNCNFAAELNMTALRTDWEDATAARAISYSFYMLLVCLIQILILLRQLLHSQSNATAIRVSILCIGWQTVIDALLCLGHIYLSLAMQPLFTAFASVAFFKLLIFCVIEIKYMAIILQARNSHNGGQSIDVLRRQVAFLHLRFYISFMFIFGAAVYVSENYNYRLAFVLLLYSFWVPQIVLNVITEAKAPMHTYYIYGMSLTRLVVPMYMLAFSDTFLKQLYPDHLSDVFACEMIVLWVGIQTAVLIGQSHYGARFMIPARFLPPKFDYSRPLPVSMLQPGAEAAILLYEQTHSTSTYDPKASSSSSSSTTTNTAASSSDTGITDSESQLIRARHSTTGTTTRMRGNRQNRLTSNVPLQNTSTSVRHPPSPTSNTSPELNDSGKSAVTTTANAPSILPPPPCCLLECSICYEDIDIRKRKDYMLAPCNHLFHRPCLTQWMDVKMECPICRTELPTT